MIVKIVKIFLVNILLLIFIILPSAVLASSTDGTIDSTYKYAWGENVGWLNFGTSGGNVHITDSEITGYAWSDNYGWINLNPSTSGVQNNNEGTLSGYAWGENLGWINFSGVTINSSGEFLGYASTTNDSGRISFNCSNTSSCGSSDFKVKTDWRPQSARTDTAASSGGSQMSVVYSAPIATAEKIKKVPEIFKSLVPDFLKPKPPAVKPPEVPIEELVSKEAPLAFQGKWQLLLLPRKAEFVLAPLPKAIRNLAQKFPTLEKTFKETGIVKITDVAKLKTVKLTLPGLKKIEQIPTEIVFAKTGGKKIDLSAALSITEKGEPQQKISTISGKPLQLAVKPDKPVKSVKGYLVFKSKASQPTSLEFPLNSLLASLIFANPVFAKPQEKPVRVEEKLVLLEFEYTDPDGDGIYTAEIQAPVIEGEYEIITVMDFEDPELGKKEIRLTTVIDPEGYLYEKDGDKETRIPGAIISLFWLNPETKQYEIWPAKEYQQENPQTTDVRGTYSFLVPEGYYYLKAETPGYLVYDGKPFEVKEGSGIHINIELKTKYWWLKIIDWKTILLAAVIILLLYNFYRDKIKEKMLGNF